jgi:hypothetical protein
MIERRCSLLRRVSLEVAHGDALRQRGTSVAFGAKRTLIKSRCPAGAEATPGGRAGAPGEGGDGLPATPGKDARLRAVRGYCERPRFEGPKYAIAP